MRRPGTPRVRRQATTDASLTTDDADEEETGPLRRCAVTRERLPKEAMIRFVVGPERIVVPDLTARLPGRGIWLSARGDVIETACTRGAFARAARGQVMVPPDLSSVLQAALARRVGEHLGFARRAGQAVSGFQKAREWLEGGRVALVVQASDGSPDERSRFLAGWGGTVPVVAPLDAHRLGAVFGRDHAVHVVLARGRLADAVRHEAERLAGLMAQGASPDRRPTKRPDTVGHETRAPDTVGRDTRTSDAVGRGAGIVGGALPQADGSQGG